MEQNLNLYHIFYEVAGCRNFSVAAKKMYISQPAVSKAISRLEESLGVILFQRSSRGVTLTHDGEILYKHVDQALSALKSGENLIKTSTSQKIIHLSIGVSTTLCKYVLLPLLKTFIAENPNIKISISCQSTFDTISSLQANSIDIGLVGIPSDNKIKRNDSITYLPLKTIEDIFVATDSYLTSFAHTYKGDIHEQKVFFEEASFIMLNNENISRKHINTFLSAQQIELHNIIEVNHMDLSIEFAKAGLGIACVIEDFIKKELEDGTLREVKLRHKIPRRQIGFAYPSKTPLTESMKTFIQYYQTNL